MRVFVPTSNDYLHCLPSFAYLFTKHYSRKQPVVVACYERMPEGLPPNFAIHQIGRQEDYTWSSGFMKFLNEVDDELFVLIFEDCFITRRVDIELIARLGQYMHDDPRVVKIDLTGDRYRYTHDPYGVVEGVELVQTAHDAPYQFSTQPAIWRRDHMLEFLDLRENPWQSERGGTWRIMTARKEGWDKLILGVKERVFWHINAVGGQGAHPREWSRKYFSPELWSELSSRGLV